jgi:uncharacterized protein YecT (DUF1311 family)
MRHALLPFTACLAMALSPAQALDCGKASAPVEQLICATPALKKADAAMSAAYFKRLRETKDPEFRDALLRSQRRWLEAREEEFKPDAGPPDDDNSNALLQATRDRLKFLQGSEPLRKMEQLRKAASRDSGGAYAGYIARCTFSPPSGGRRNYLCLGEAHRQHKDRICSVGLDWTSGHTTDYRLVSVVQNGEPRPVATCAIGYSPTRERCPDPDNDAEAKAAAHWNTNPQPFDALPEPTTEGLWKYDPDIALNAQPWMDQCTSSAIYPPPEQSRSDPAPVKKKST